MDGSASRSTRCAFFSMVSRFCNLWFLLVGVIFHGDGSLLPFGGSPWSLGLGLALIAGGQTLNLSVFYRLGKVGVLTAIDLAIRFPSAGVSLLIVQGTYCTLSAYFEL